MATLTITSATGADTTSKVLTYSGADAQNIFNLWTKYVWSNIYQGNPPMPPPAPTHQDFTNWCASHLQDLFQDWNRKEGSFVTIPPQIPIS